MLKKLLMILMIFSNQVFADQQEKNYSILTDIAEVIEIFTQCSRMTPSFRTSYSRLDAELVEKIETKLPEAFERLAAGKKIELDDYYRQYVSFGMLRRELVYISAIHKEAANEWAGDDVKRKEALANWQTKSVNICGGKGLHWGAIYDGSGDIISEIIFNSAAKK